MGSLELSPPVFSILSGLIADKAGLYYGPQDRELLEQKLSARAEEAGFETLLDYYYYLRYDAGGEAEFSVLIDHLVVNETYFFRELHPLKILTDSFIVPWCAEGRRPRIWCAACATGEEPLSLAMLLHERGLLNRVEIVATDISSRALSKARQGVYGKRSVRQIPDPQLFERYIRPKGETYGVDPTVAEAIQWSRCNLLGETDVEAQGVFDVILCRNVLIYFADPTVMHLLKRFSKVLTADGVLLIGISESLLRYGSDFIGEERDGAFLYRNGKKTP